jgi:hypothetical protein
MSQHVVEDPNYVPWRRWTHNQQGGHFELGSSNWIFQLDLGSTNSKKKIRGSE